MIIPAVWVIVRDTNDNVFLLQRANSGWRDGSWAVPAGHIEEHESPSAAAIREVHEEAGITVHPENLSDPLIYFYPEDAMEHDRVSLFYTYVDEERGCFNAEPAKASEGKWFAPNDLPKEMPPLLRHALIDIRRGLRYSERFYDPTNHKELLQ